MTKASRKSNRLSPTEIKIIMLLLQKTKEATEKVVISKREMSELLDCDPRSLDRNVERLRKRGIVRVHMRYDDRGSQLANSYELVQEKLAEFLPQIKAELTQKESKTL